MTSARRKRDAADRLHRATRTVSALLSLWLPAPAPAQGKATAGRVVEIAAFGSNPGGLRMLVYTPARLPADAPLVVVLHGCQQDATSFAANAGWLALARHLRCALVLPEQTAENNRGRCFNWHRPADARRGAGEAKSIRQMVSVATKRFRSDRRRVFVVGLSAGGAMAVALLAAYPASVRRRGRGGRHAGRHGEQLRHGVASHVPRRSLSQPSRTGRRRPASAPDPIDAVVAAPSIWQVDATAR